MQDKLKEDKQKVTLYLPQDLHRQLKIKAAVDAETMTELTQRAIVFYLNHSEVVEQYESFGQSHRVYSCPECSSHIAFRNGDVVALQSQLGILSEEGLTVEQPHPIGVSSEGEGELVPC